MAKQILIIHGHPDASGSHFGHALVTQYAEGARQAGHSVRIIEVAALEFPVLRRAEDFQNGQPVPAIASAQVDLGWANHVVIVYPLWLGAMPALLKAFFEQLFRPGFAFVPASGGKPWQKKLKGKTCRIVVTMGMPVLAYRWLFGAYSLKSLERSILGFCGIGPIRETLIGMVEADAGKREKWLQRLRVLGEQGG